MLQKLKCCQEDTLCESLFLEFNSHLLSYQNKKWFVMIGAGLEPMKILMISCKSFEQSFYHTSS